MANYYERIIGHARFNGSQTTYYVDITADTAADIPNPADHPEWEVGSWLHVLEGGGSLFTLGNDRSWHQQGAMTASVADTAAQLPAYDPETADEVTA